MKAVSRPRDSFLSTFHAAKMSAWTEWRDNAESILKEGLGDVNDDMKQEANAWLLETGIPLAESAATNVTEQLAAQVKTENNLWCKARDGVSYPVCIKLALYFAKKVLTKTASIAPAA